jgi:LPXTG-motif cell wall-anchored protein
MGMEDFNLDDEEEKKPLDREGFNLDDNLEQPAEAPLAEESSNRTFLIIAAALGGIALIALVCIAVYALVLWPRAQSAQASRRATLEAQNTEVAVIIASTSTSAAETAMAAQFTATPTQTSLAPTATATPSPTPVVAVPTATQPAPANMSENATATALHATLQANATLYAATLTAKPLQPTAIPNTGFADDVGLPMMLGIAVLLVLVIFLARRLRTT